MKNVPWGQACEEYPALREMIDLAIVAWHSVYAPASHFSVGAVVEVKEHPGTLSGRSLFFSGCNVENAMYMATHAEQAAIAMMVGKLGVNPKPFISAVAVACVAERADQYATPCGFCRQWIYEFGNPATAIYGIRLASNQPSVLSVECTTLGELLPYAFRL